MLPQAPVSRKRNSGRTNLLISLFFHGAILIALAYFAAREGFFGKQIKKIAVEMVKEKPVEKPKEPEKPKEEPPKVATPKVEQPAVVEAPKTAPPKQVAQTAPPTGGVTAPPAMAPPATDVPSFEFEGGKTVQTSSDPVQLYRSFMEYAFRSRWARPENIADENFVAEVEISINEAGIISNSFWKKGSGNSKWDDSVKAAVASTRSLDRKPPANFPQRVVVRFDVQDATEPILQ
ncbi:MAG: putative TonB-dependent receptor [Verrucomicrobiales bacterium]|nr:putative TonB-dependent receptor [Verrucomicrobiales bacterium]